MVWLRIKASDDDQFLFRTNVDARVEATRSNVVRIFNLRQRIRRLKIEGEELGRYGMAKKPEAQGIDTYTDRPIEKGPFYEMDPTGKRDGNGCCPTARDTLFKTLKDALEALNKKHAANKTEITEAELLQSMDLIKGAVTICYPMGLPEWDPVRRLLEDHDSQTETYGYEMHESSEMDLWFAGKRMIAGNRLREYIGDKEATTAIVRLIRADQGAPSREPIVDEETYKGMLSWSFKKQEEQKALAENEEDQYLESSWANNKSLKQHLNGLTNVRI